jgi:hypothetical protein
MGLQMLIMPNKKLYVLITYMVLDPLAPWAPGGRTTYPPLRAGPDDYGLDERHGATPAVLLDPSW